MSWDDRAACRDQSDSIFFAPLGARRGYYDAARAICNACPILEECLEYALNNDIREGFWGGTAPTERKRMINQRRKSRT